MSELTHVRSDDADPASGDLAGDALFAGILAWLDSLRETDGAESSPEKVKASTWKRSAVLTVASQLTRAHGDAAAVTANARPLLAWLEAADSEDDLEARHRALWQQHLNEDLADDDPDRFLAEAAQLYALMTSGTEA